MGRLSALVLFTFVLVGAAPASAEGEIVLGARSDCRREEAVAVRLRELIGEYPAHAGDCVATEGYYHAHALFRRREDSFRHRAQSSAAMANRRIGIYARDEDLAAMQALKGRRLRLYGRLSDCAALGADAVLVLGYCHYAGGPILLVSGFERAR